MDTLHKILHALELRGMSDRRLQELIGVSEGAVNDWRRGKSKSYMKRVPQIAEALGVSEEYLLHDDTELEFLQGIKKESLEKYQAIVSLYNALEEIGLVDSSKPLAGNAIQVIADFLKANKTFLDKNIDSGGQLVE